LSTKPAREQGLNRLVNSARVASFLHLEPNVGDEQSGHLTLFIRTAVRIPKTPLKAPLHLGFREIQGSGDGLIEQPRKFVRI